MTWDTVADYLPVETADAALDARLARVAAFARGRCLDVGCGDGAMVPHLKARAAYCGVDLSARMVSLARRRHPDARFERAGFFEFVAGGEEAAWDTILFVAALQFFPDVDAVLAACAARLAPGGRVVVAHVRGAAFVRQERRGNPAVVEALPAVEDLLAAGGFGLVHAEEDLGPLLPRGAGEGGGCRLTRTRVDQRRGEANLRRCGAEHGPGIYRRTRYWVAPAASSCQCPMYMARVK